MTNQLDWNAPWMEHIPYILDHLEELELDERQIIGLLLIEHFNRCGKPVTHDLISKKTGWTPDQVETVFAGLSDRGYLTFAMENGKLRFNTEGILEAGNGEGDPMQKSLIEEFEEALGRGLSSAEMQRIIDMGRTYGELRTLIALDEAAAYQHRDIHYVEKVLDSWQRKGLSTEELQKGYRNERK